MPDDKVQIYNPDLPEGPDNKGPKGKGKARPQASAADDWRQQRDDEDRRQDWEDEKSKKEAKATGRPRAIINWDVFDELCRMFCTLDEIAGFFKVSPDTIRRACRREYGQSFEETFAISSAPGKVSVKRAMFRSAVGGNVLAQIWVGKQYLGHRDTPAPPDDQDKDKDAAAQDVYGITFYGKPGDENTRQQVPGPEPVRPYNANPGPNQPAA